MRCVCLTLDNVLIDKLKAKNIFETVDSSHELAHFLSLDINTCDVLIVSDQLVKYPQLDQISNKTSPYCQICYLLSSHPDSHLSMNCLNNGVSLIPPQLSPDQKTEHILKLIFPEAEKRTSKVISLFGSQPCTGVTSLTLALAKYLASLQVNVGVLGLNVNNSGDYFISKYTGLYLDELKSYLSNRVFSEDQLTCSMSTIHNFKYLAGNRDIKKRLHYTTDEIEYLIQLARNAFDLVLIDSGAHFDNALTIQSLISSDLRFLVSTQSFRALNTWNLTFEQIIEPLGFNTGNFLMIVNRFKDNINLPKPKFLVEEYKISVLQAIPDLGDLGLIAEQDKMLLTEFQVKHYHMAVAKIAENICRLYGIPIQLRKTEINKGILQKLFSLF